LESRGVQGGASVLPFYVLPFKGVPVSETQDEGSKRALRELEGKNVAHYSVLLQAWINTRMNLPRLSQVVPAPYGTLLRMILPMINHCDWCRDHLRQPGQLHSRPALRLDPGQ
jgi:hypothetical protein